MKLIIEREPGGDITLNFHAQTDQEGIDLKEAVSAGFSGGRSLVFDPQLALAKLEELGYDAELPSAAASPSTSEPAPTEGSG